MNVGSISFGGSGRTLLNRTKTDMMHFPGKSKQKMALSKKIFDSNKIESSNWDAVHFNLNILIQILYCEL